MRIFKIALPILLLSSAALAAPTSHPAKDGPSGEYIDSGFFVGGDKSVTAVTVKDIRRSSNPGFERVVLDLSALPAFVVNLDAQNNRAILSLWGDVSYRFDKSKVAAAFKKSAKIDTLRVVPIMEDGVATIEFALKSKGPHRIKAFHLAKEPRLVIDFVK